MAWKNYIISISNSSLFKIYFIKSECSATKEKCLQSYVLLVYLLLKEKNLRTSFKCVTSVSQKFCNILVHASLQHLYPMTEAVEAVEGTICG